MRLAVVASHPVQYYAPLFRELARRVDLTVFYGHAATAQDQAQAGFGVGFSWDVDLLSGYRSEFLTNVATRPGLSHFRGVDTPEIRWRLRTGNFDALMLMGWNLKCFLQALFHAKVIGLPVMVRGDSHLETPRSALKTAIKRMLYPHFMRQFDVALVVGTRNRAYWAHYGYPAARMFDAPHCVDNAFFASRATPEARAALRGRLGIAPDTRVVLFAGKLVPFKRPLDLVQAVAHVRSQKIDLHILVAGAGPLENDMRARAEDLGVPLHCLGFCNQSAMPAAYAAADLLVLSSNGQETWGLVVNEALACGTPALVSDAVGCAPDVAEVLGAQVIFPLADVAELAARMADALDDPPHRSVIVRAAERFSIRAAVEGIVKALVKSDYLRGRR